MRKSRDRVSYYDKIMLPLRKRIVEESHLMFNAMEVGPFELLETKRDEIMAKRDRVESLREYWLARSELERAMGGSFRCYSCAEPAASAAANNTAKILQPPADSAPTENSGAMNHAAHAGGGAATSGAGSGTGSGAGSDSGAGAASAGSAGGAS